MIASKSRRTDLRLRRHSQAAALVLCAVAGAALSWRASDRRAWAGHAGPVDRAKVAAVRERIDPNSAPAGSLRRLPGIGPKLAEAIVETRNRAAAEGRPTPFRTAADLDDRVPGIGPVTAARILPYLDLPGESAAAP